MITKIKVLIVMVSLSITLCVMSNTYSRYVASSSGDVSATLAKWQILLNNNDITNNSVNNIEITPTIVENNNVAAGTVAPSSTGYFDIAIDATNVDVAFTYNVSLDVLNENMPDLIISKYALLDANDENTQLDFINIDNNTISDTVFNNKTFTIRIYFEWFEGQDESMSNEDDTLIGTDAAINNTNLNINATIDFAQYIN